MWKYFKCTNNKINIIGSNLSLLIPREVNVPWELSRENSSKKCSLATAQQSLNDARQIEEDNGNACGTTSCKPRMADGKRFAN